MNFLRDSERLLCFTLAHRRVRGKEFSFDGHEYLRGLYQDESPLVVIRKAAQMGASEYAISRALWFAITMGGTALYYFPTDHDVGEFSRDRFGPAVAESPGSGRVASEAMRSTKTSAPAPNQIRSRSHPAASTRNVSAVWAIAYPLAEPLSIRAYWTPHASAARRISAGVPVSPMNPAS